ncbi:unnamed protein product [Durusdinium trenchii]|uniref:Uncharacterized protein n=1 Tax=Durusdinium trenchii TaxID=1381693 RepID=A0ABP0PGB9_9DINO
MLANDPLVREHFPQYLPSEDELSATAQLVAEMPSNEMQLKEFVAIHADVKATLRRFCWQAKQDGLTGAACAQEAVKLLNLCLERRAKYWASFIDVVPQTYHGLGPRGQPIVLIRTGGIDPAAFNKLQSTGQEHAVADVNAAVLCFLRCEECLFRKTVPEESESVGHLADRIILIIDLWGMVICAAFVANPEAVATSSHPTQS